MYKVEPMMPSDIFALDVVNLDTLTENFTLNYYLYYLLNHSEDCAVVFSDGDGICGYLIGKLEEKEGAVCAHLSALSIAPAFRKNGLGMLLMGLLEENGNLFGAHFADLYVRASNGVAVRFYESLGYVVYRRILEYYSGPSEEALDMRKSLDRDKEKKCMRRGEDIHASYLD
jgi:N-terminal acetyltransferase B complex catalytic subunit